jgi:quercetin dioxygenase-like cupin family protein
MQVSKGRSGADSVRLTETFTGEVWVDPVLAAAEGNTINNVTFQPQARTYWHSHQFGQILHVTVGRGVVCSEGQPARSLEVGDYVWVPPGERHWHGGAPGSCVTHTAISLGMTTWGDPVSDEEYGEAVATLA